MVIRDDGGDQMGGVMIGMTAFVGRRVQLLRCERRTFDPTFDRVDGFARSSGELAVCDAPAIGPNDRDALVANAQRP